MNKTDEHICMYRNKFKKCYLLLLTSLLHLRNIKIYTCDIKALQI